MWLRSRLPRIHFASQAACSSREVYYLCAVGHAYLKAKMEQIEKQIEEFAADEDYRELVQKLESQTSSKPTYIRVANAGS